MCGTWRIHGNGKWEKSGNVRGELGTRMGLSRMTFCHWHRGLMGFGRSRVGVGVIGAELVLPHWLNRSQILRALYM